MDKSITITLIIVAGVLLLGFAGLMTFSSLINPMQEKISVNGQSSVKAIPDLVGVYFNAKITAKTSQEATTQLAQIVDELRTALIKNGFENKDIQTLNYNVYEDYDYTSYGSKLKGYTASQTIRVILGTNDSSKIGEVIDSGVEAGVQISYINFELSQELENKLKAEAMKLAAQDSRIKAESVAEGLDKDLGKLVSVSVDNWGYYPMRMYDYAEGASLSSVKETATSITPSEQEISASVTAVFKIN